MQTGDMSSYFITENKTWGGRKSQNLHLKEECTIFGANKKNKKKKKKKKKKKRLSGMRIRAFIHNNLFLEE